MKPSNPLFDHIHDFCFQQKLVTGGSTLIVGLSGGPDSVFLLHYLASLQEEKNLTLIAAHLDHGWRAESAQEALFCRQVAEKYKVPYIVKNLKDTPAFKFNGSKEELGRKARRAFFEQLAHEHGATAIALAHHADDQMETFFMRLIRGSSLTGLTGMKSQDGLYIRPLLAITKDEILKYLAEHQIAYVIDASNQSDEYLRNRIRNSVIPALKTCDDRFKNNFAHTHAKLVETADFLQQLSQATLENVSDASNSLDISKFMALHPVLRSRILINWLILNKVPFTPSQGLIDEIVRFLENSKNKVHHLHNKWYLHKDSTGLLKIEN